MGFFTIIFRKRDKMNDISNEFSNLQKIIGVYLKNYDFSREIELLLRTFSEDQNRVNVPRRRSESSIAIRGSVNWV